MKINIITIGKASDSWLETGYKEYAKRIPSNCQINLLELPPVKRTKSSNISNLLTMEANRLIAAVPQNSLMIALDEHGQEFNTFELTRKMSVWYQEQQDITLIVGGPDGLAPLVIESAYLVWSLSRLTLPHQLVKIIIIEQIYRAWSIMNNHPYHRN